MRVSWLEIEIPGWEILVARTRALQLISLKPQSNSRVEHIMSEKGLPVREWTKKMGGKQTFFFKYPIQKNGCLPMTHRFIWLIWPFSYNPIHRKVVLHVFRPVENLPEISSRCQMEPLHFEDHDVVKQRARLSFPQPRGFFGPFMGVERSTGELSVEIGKVILLVGKPLDCI